MLPGKDAVTVCFAHVAYALGESFARRNTGIAAFQVWNAADLEGRIGEADVLVISGLWRDALLERAGKLCLIQAIGAGTDQFGREALTRRGIRLASARGVNARAVSQHAMALMLALVRRLPEARDNQRRRVWRGMIGDPAGREDELDGKTLLIVGLGDIGGRIAALAKPFGMHVVGLRRDPANGAGAAAAVHRMDALGALLPEADFVCLTCPLTPETENLIDGPALGRMKRSAYLVNLARGRCVDEAALADALATGQIAGAAIDVVAEEPLPSESPLWGIDTALITPHSAGETRRYEDGVLDILEDNLARLWRGEAALRNQIL